MRMMQVAMDQIIDMVPVRYHLMAAARPMHMALFVAYTGVIGRTAVGGGRRDLDRVLIHMVTVHMVQVAVMDVVHMVQMVYCGVTTAGTVLMQVLGVVRQGTGFHGVDFLFGRSWLGLP